MRALILAAGRGSRMGALCADQPKCFTQLAGRRLLDWQLAALRGADIDRVALVRGYCGDAFIEPLTYFDNPRWAQTNMVSTLLAADTWLASDECIVSYADIVYGVDSVRRLAAARGELAIAYDPHWRRLWELRFEDPLADAETFRLDAAGRVVEIGRRTENIAEIEGQYMGLLKFTPAGWHAVKCHLAGLPGEAVDRLDMTGLLSRLIAAGIAVNATAIAEPWFEVDSENDLRAYEPQLQDRNPFQE